LTYKRSIAVALAVLSAAGICFLTLRSGGTEFTRGWSFYLTAGDDALAALLQNLILFIPLGVSLTLAGVKPFRVVAIGGLLSFGVEFLQQWIPGRDPSLGDIVCNTISTALGVLLVVAAPIWLFAPPRRSVWQARLNALIAVVVWFGTGVMLRQDFPPQPYRLVTRPDLPYFARYQGEIIRAITDVGKLEVLAIAAPYPPGRTAPLVAVLGSNDERVLMLSVDGPDLTLRYYMPALRWTLEQPDLRLHDGMKPIAPGDTFTAGTSHDSTNICLRVNATSRCHLGYTIGDGWKLIYYPERRPPWQLGFINTLWVFGCVVGVGFWAAKGDWLGVGIVVAGLLLVPLMTGLKPTPVYEWFGALGGMAVGYLVASRSSLGATSNVAT